MTCVLLTRPLPDSQSLQQQLAEVGIQAICQPLIQIRAGRQLKQLASQLAQADIVIAVSKHAAIHATQAMSHSWPATATYIAVGSATQTAWQHNLNQPIVVPSQQDSEGLLALPQLQSVKRQRVLILRGQKGRELLAQELSARGADVHYCECYQREAITLNSSRLVPYWQQQGVSVTVVTSVEQLELLQQLCHQDFLPWLYSTTLVTVSQRIADTAQQAGFVQVIVSSGTDNATLKTTLQQVLKKAKSS